MDESISDKREIGVCMDTAVAKTFGQSNIGAEALFRVKLTVTKE